MHSGKRHGGNETCYECTQIKDSKLAPQVQDTGRKFNLTVWVVCLLSAVLDGATYFFTTAIQMMSLWVSTRLSSTQSSMGRPAMLIIGLGTVNLIQWNILVVEH